MRSAKNFLLGLFLSVALMATLFTGARFARELKRALAWVTGKPNLILISIDAARPDRMSVYGYERNTTPQIKWAARRGGAVFTNHFAESNWTLPSHMTLLTGQPQFTHLVADSNIGRLEYVPSKNFSLPARVPTLADLLQKEGYSTYGFWSMFDQHLQAARGLGRGFQILEPYGLDNEAHATLIASELTRAAAARKPFFAFIHSKVAHGPYIVPAANVHFAKSDLYENSIEKYAELGRMHGRNAMRAFHSYVEKLGANPPPLSELEKNVFSVDAVMPSEIAMALVLKKPLSLSEQRRLKPAASRDAYDDAIRYADKLVGTILRALEHEGLLENTVIAVVSDHGEELGERGRYGHGTLSSEVLRSAFVLIDPRLGPGIREVNAFTQTFDVAPTLAPFVAAPFFGVDLNPLARGERFSRPDFAFGAFYDTGAPRTYAVMSPEWKFNSMVSGNEVKYPAGLFSVAEGKADETKDWSEEKPEQVEALKAEFAKYWDKIRMHNEKLQGF